jgi:hypothetical protein
MNCFNIRELQSVLRRKFFVDLINTHDHTNFLSESMIGLRFKLNSNYNLEHDIFTFYNFGLHNNNFNRLFDFKKAYVTPEQSLLITSFDKYLLSFFETRFNINVFQDPSTLVKVVLLSFEYYLHNFVRVFFY